MKLEKYFLLNNNFTFNLTTKPDEVFEATMKIKKNHKIKYLDNVDTTLAKLLTDKTPFSNATYWLNAKDIKKLGMSAQEKRIIPVDKNAKKALKEYVRKILLSNYQGLMATLRKLKSTLNLVGENN